MAEEIIGKATIVSSVDTTDIDTGVASAKKSLASLGDDARKAGAQLGEGLGGGPGLPQASANVDRATKQIIASIQRTSAALDAGERNSRKFYESLANQRGINTDILKPYLDQLDEVKKKSQEAQKAMQGMGPAVQQVGVSAAQTAAAMRGVPAQFTDIVTSIQGGQRPISVLLQQGGQLKDMFGGVGPAAKALGGYILGLINPFTLAAGAVAAMAYAFLTVESNTTKLNQSLTLAGNAARGTADDFNAMASALSGSTGSAIDSLLTMANTGKVAQENLQDFTRIAQDLDRTVGIPVSETAKRFAELADKPLEASLKLNQAYGYMTVATYNQIKALVDQGRETDAARVAMEAFANAMGNRIPDLERQMGFFSKRWQELKVAINEATRAVQGFVGANSSADPVAQAEKELARAQARAKGNGAFGQLQGDSQAEVQAAQQRLDALRAVTAGTQAQTKAVQDAGKAENDRVKNMAAWDAIATRYEDNATKRQKALAEAALAASKNQTLGTAQYEKVVKEINERFKDKVDASAGRAAKDVFNASLESLKQQAALSEQVTKDNVDRLDSMRKQGAISQIEYIEQVTAAEVAQLQTRRAVVQEELRLSQTQKDNRRQSAQFAGELAKIDQQIANRANRGSRDVQETISLRERQAYIETMREQVQAQEEQNQALVKSFDAWSDARGSLMDYNKALKEENESSEFELSLFGKSAAEQRVLIELRKNMIALRREEEAIKARHLPEVDQTRMIQEAQDAAAERATQITTQNMVREYQDASRQIGETFFDILMNKGANAARSLKSLFSKLVLEPVVRAGVNAIAGGIGGAVGGASAFSGTAGTSSVLSGLGSIGSLMGSIGAGEGFAMGIGGYAGGLSGIASSAGAGISLIGGGQVMAGIGALAGALGPIALGVYALYKAFAGKKGGPKEGFYLGSASPVGANAIGAKDTFNADLARAGQQTLRNIDQQFNVIASAFGGSGGGTRFGLGVSTDPKGTSPSFVEVNARNGAGALIGRSVNTQVGRTAEEVNAAIENQVADALIQALKASNIAPEFHSFFDSIADSTDAATKMAAIQIAKDVAEITRAFDSLPPAFSQFRNLSIQARAGMIELAGGAQALAGLAGSFAQNFYRDDERKNAEFVGLARGFGQLGVEMPKTNEAFRQLVEAQDLTTAAGQRTYVSLLQMSAQFADLYPLMEETTDRAGGLAAAQERLADAQNAVRDAYNRERTAIEQTINRLDSFTQGMRRFKDSLINGPLSPYTPTERYAKTQTEYSITKAQAMAGDTNAQDRFTEVAQQFLEASQQLNASGPAFQNDFNRVMQDTVSMEATARNQLDASKGQLAALERMVNEAMPDLANNVISVRDAIDRMNAAQWEVAQFQTANSNAQWAASQAVLEQARVAFDQARAQATAVAAPTAALQGGYLPTAAPIVDALGRVITEISGMRTEADNQTQDIVQSNQQTGGLLFSAMQGMSQAQIDALRAQQWADAIAAQYNYGAAGA